MEPVTITSTFQKAEKLTPKDLIRKHIADPTHKITEEEFDKLIVGVFSSETVEDRALRQS